MSQINRRRFLAASSATAGVAALKPTFAHATPPRVRVVGLKVDYLDRPIGLENRRPLLSWRLESDARNVRQSAYRILVASDEALLRAGRGDLWDSGKIESKKSFGIPYRGRELTSRQRCWWSVRIWDDKRTAYESGEVSGWEVGLL